MTFPSLGRCAHGERFRGSLRCARHVLDVLKTCPVSVAEFTLWDCSAAKASRGRYVGMTPEF